ncbi:glycoside hydrolase family 17 protein [Ephemerocybe angulata]|uniref:glucan endo-1,3-beta-D-glucosidase n=1 Tax=Ephemerocybe angulata TaxID=980116 RepID=A0A8H6MFG2_9AGAR|nr:glycoside hydrolase family 17 protein [Tulosesus angulatus]
MSNHGSNYQSIGMSQAMDAGKARSRKSKFIIIGSVVGLLVLAAIGIAVGVTVSNNNKKNASTSGSSSSSSSGSGGNSNTGSTTGGTKSDPNDPSNFTKDPNLHQAFYGMAYTPEGALIEFGCTNTLESVIQDIQLMSQLTKRVRLYGADCNQTAQVLEAITRTNVDMEVFVGIYNVADDNHAAYQRQRDLIKDAISTYGTKHIGGITVGNEFMLNYVTDKAISDVNSADAQVGADILIADIKDAKQMVQDLKLDKAIPVGNSDAGSYFPTTVMEAMDYGLSNVHAWFAHTTATAAAPWVFNFFQETNVSPAALLANKPQMYIAETGWPTKSSDAKNANNGGSDASVPNLQIFLDDFVCKANQDGVRYFFFEMFDEEWKDVKFGGVEGWWGLFNKDRTLKDVKIPTCTSP